MMKSTNYCKRALRLDEFMMGRIVGARDAGLNFSKIGALYNLPKSTVSSVVYRTAVRKEKATNLKMGRPLKMSVKDERRVIRLLKKTPHMKYEDILQNIGSKISLRNLQRFLRRKKIAVWIAKKRPYLTTKDARRRLQWAI